MLKTIQFILFFTGLYAILHVLVVRDNPYLANREKYAAQLRGLQDHPAKYLIVGDSHAGMIDQSWLDKRFYNLGTASDSMNEIYIKIAYAVQHDPHFKYLLLTADFHILSKYRDAFNNKAYIKPFASPEDYQFVYGEPYSTDWVSDRLSRYPLFDYNVYVTGRESLIGRAKALIKGKKYVESKDKQWIEHPQEARDRRAAERAQIHLTRIITEENRQRYLDIIDLCRRHNITVIGLRYPLSPEYLHEMSTYDLTPLDKHYAGIQFDKFLDYSRLLSEHRYFVDMDHMNEEGVQRFLEKLYANLALGGGGE
ncbi:MAG: hypothetical protein K8I00_03805 [Candidatus Omnitrophica bacterium]|nr:hypothetical protein [Candidatus Omnitrophota bacterium]